MVRYYQCQSGFGQKFLTGSLRDIARKGIFADCFSKRSKTNLHKIRLFAIKKIYTKSYEVIVFLGPRSLLKVIYRVKGITIWLITLELFDRLLL